MFSMTASEILAQWDEAASRFVFPMLDNGYVYLGDTRLTIYRDAVDWLMIIEVLGAGNPRTCGCDSFHNLLHIFGSGLPHLPGTMNEGFLYPISSIQDDPLFADEYDWDVRVGAKSLEIRGQRIDFDVSEVARQQKEIALVDPPAIDPAAVLRSLLPEHRDLLLASEEELLLRNPRKLPLWMRLDAWHHPDLAADVLPSQSETFIMLAEAIASGDKGRYRPTQNPNTHWKNWPEGGAL